jgi:hypothetical protein
MRMLKALDAMSVQDLDMLGLIVLTKSKPWMSHLSGDGSSVDDTLD